jgi:predicted NBD/HSP70 family sugar kinase
MKSQPLAVFDIGGTWFRSGIYVHTNEIKSLRKQSAYNYKNTSHKEATELQEKLAVYLNSRFQQLRKQMPQITAAVVSMGAAVNGHTGKILNSGPLWGPECKPFDLLSRLRREAPDIDWLIINDVSAALLRYTKSMRKVDYKRVCLVTVSTGIACRTYDKARDYIPLNRAGIQGEIGHIPIHLSLFNQPIDEICDCGGKNHLNAFCSGRGIENIIQRSDIPYQDLDQFFAAVRTGEGSALGILHAITLPIAQMIVSILTIDPEIEKIIITGGVVHRIEQQYLESLLSSLNETGIYQIANHDTFFRNVVEIGSNDDNSGLLGAAFAYENGFTNKTT